MDNAYQHSRSCRVSSHDNGIAKTRSKSNSTSPRHTRTRQPPVAFRHVSCRTWSGIVSEVRKWARKDAADDEHKPKTLLLLDIDNTVLTTPSRPVDDEHVVPVERGRVYAALDNLKALLGRYDVAFLTARYAWTRDITTRQLEEAFGQCEAFRLRRTYVHFTGGKSKGDYIRNVEDKREHQRLQRALLEYDNIIFVDDLIENTTDVLSALVDLCDSGGPHARYRALVVHYTQYPTQ